VNTSVDKAVRDLDSFETWTTEAIERRQDQLRRLARRVWDMPEAL
jgi:hypothetical protein